MRLPFKHSGGNPPPPLELGAREGWDTRTEARSAVFEYIEVFYNRLRRHSYLGYVSPESFEQAARISKSRSGGDAA